jgi:hypothetical protein
MMKLQIAAFLHYNLKMIAAQWKSVVLGISLPIRLIKVSTAKWDV